MQFFKQCFHAYLVINVGPYYILFVLKRVHIGIVLAVEQYKMFRNELIINSS